MVIKACHASKPSRRFAFCAMLLFSDRSLHCPGLSIALPASMIFWSCSRESFHKGKGNKSRIRSVLCSGGCKLQSRYSRRSPGIRATCKQTWNPTWAADMFAGGSSSSHLRKRSISAWRTDAARLGCSSWLISFSNFLSSSSSCRATRVSFSFLSLFRLFLSLEASRASSPPWAGPSLSALEPFELSRWLLGWSWMPPLSSAPWRMKTALTPPESGSSERSSVFLLPPFRISDGSPETGLLGLRSVLDLLGLLLGSSLHLGSSSDSRIPASAPGTRCLLPICSFPACWWLLSTFAGGARPSELVLSRSLLTAGPRLGESTRNDERDSTLHRGPTSPLLSGAASERPCTGRFRRPSASPGRYTGSRALCGLLSLSCLAGGSPGRSGLGTPAPSLIPRRSCPWDSLTDRPGTWPSPWGRIRSAARASFLPTAKGLLPELRPFEKARQSCLNLQSLSWSQSSSFSSYPSFSFSSSCPWWICDQPAFGTLASSSPVPQHDPSASYASLGYWTFSCQPPDFASFFHGLLVLLQVDPFDRKGQHPVQFQPEPVSELQVPPGPRLAYQGVSPVLSGRDFPPWSEDSWGATCRCGWLHADHLAEASSCSS